MICLPTPASESGRVPVLGERASSAPVARLLDATGQTGSIRSGCSSGRCLVAPAHLSDRVAAGLRVSLLTLLDEGLTLEEAAAELGITPERAREILEDAAAIGGVRC